MAKVPVYERRSTMPVSADELYAWHARPGAFERLAPPWQRLRVVERSGTIEDGDRLVMEAPVGPAHVRWVAVHREHVPGRQFVDVQEKGPFALWRHRHAFEPEGELQSTLHDTVEYELPGPPAVTRAGAGAAQRRLERLFAFRHERTRDDLERHLAFADRPRLRVAIAGASGFVGSHLTAFLTTGGHEVVRLTRRRDPGPGWVHWDPATGTVDQAALEGVDAVVNLAGTSLAWLWTPARRRDILESRRQTTGLVATAAAALPRPPRVVISASAVGFYGSRGAEELTEESAAGQGFLPEVCKIWEDSLEPARAGGIRTVSLRFGLVWGGAGGMLPLMAMPFKAALGTRLGDGEQWMSWVAIDDLLGAALLALYDEGLSGPVNVTSPGPVTNRDFTRTLARVVRRPAPFAAPQGLLERGLGDMGRELLLTSQRVRPARLTAAGFRWLFPDLEAALRFELGR
ncbi:MAG TPA: TIGR01777 family oxidoreductase [Thermoleophilia bacterium]|nr:TIGR01777 family oxidoreductase [Thermoleophilia bacterium]